MKAPWRAALVVAAGMLVLPGCAADDAASSPADGTETVVLAMDYFPGSVHNGLAYAMHEGLFAEAGITLEILPYASAIADTLVAAGTADVGLSSDLGSAITAFASGAKSQAIFSVQPAQPFKLGVLASSGITGPTGLAGTTHGGYGAQLETVLVDEMIAGDGGTGQTTQMVLSTGSYEALKAGQVTSTLLYPEHVFQFEQDGIELNLFENEDYGVPAASGALIVAADSWLAEKPDLAKAFVAALQQGYQMAIDDPETATAALVAEFPDVDADLVGLMAADQAETILPNPFGAVGTLSLDQWTAYADWMADNDLLADANGAPLDSFDPAPFVTNEYLQ